MGLHMGRVFREGYGWIATLAIGPLSLEYQPRNVQYSLRRLDIYWHEENFFTIGNSLIWLRLKGKKFRVRLPRIGKTNESVTIIEYHDETPNPWGEL